MSRLSKFDKIFFISFLGYKTDPQSIIFKFLFLSKFLINFSKNLFSGIQSSSNKMIYFALADKIPLFLFAE